MNTQRKRGRRPLSDTDRTNNYTVCITTRQRDYIEEQHGSLSAAIRLLTAGGRYEQLIAQNTELENKLAALVHGAPIK